MEKYTPQFCEPKVEQLQVNYKRRPHSPVWVLLCLIMQLSVSLNTCGSYNTETSFFFASI
jgi:hypothetical protein